MKVSRNRKILFALVVLVVVVGGGAYYFWFRCPAYELVDLGSLGGSYGEATAVNNLGRIAGWSKIDEDDDHAFLWDSSD